MKKIKKGHYAIIILYISSATQCNFQSQPSNLWKLLNLWNCERTTFAIHGKSTAEKIAPYSPRAAAIMRTAAPLRDGNSSIQKYITAEQTTSWITVDQYHYATNPKTKKQSYHTSPWESDLLVVDWNASKSLRAADVYINIRGKK